MTAQPIEPEWTLVDRLRKARQTAGMTQHEFDLALGLPKNTVSKYESGTRPRDVVDLARRVERASGVSALWVLGVSPIGRTAADQRLTANGCLLTTRRADNVMMTTDHGADVHDLTVERERRRADRRRVIAPYQPWHPGRSPKRVTHSEPTASRAAITHGVRYATTGDHTAVAASA